MWRAHGFCFQHVEAFIFWLIAQTIVDCLNNCHTVQLSAFKLSPSVNITTATGCCWHLRFWVWHLPSSTPPPQIIHRRIHAHTYTQTHCSYFHIHCFFKKQTNKQANCFSQQTAKVGQQTYCTSQQMKWKQVQLVTGWQRDWLSDWNLLRAAVLEGFKFWLWDLITQNNLWRYTGGRAVKIGEILWPPLYYTTYFPQEWNAAAAPKSDGSRREEEGGEEVAVAFLPLMHISALFFFFPHLRALYWWWWWWWWTWPWKTWGLSPSIADISPPLSFSPPLAFPTSNSTF